MKSTGSSEGCATTLTPSTRGNINQLQRLLIQLLRSCGTNFTYSVDFIYGYSYLIPSELCVCYFFLYYASILNS
jgi:hypothetical protein